MRLLLVNWLDRENPQAGGAEQHLHEIFGRLVERGHHIDMITSGWKGSATDAAVDGMHVTRHGGRHSFAFLGRGAVRRTLRARQYDLVVEDVNKIPLFLPTLTDLPFYLIVPHLFGTTAFSEAPWPLAAVVWAAERPIPRVYRRASVHAISNATREDLVARGVRRETIHVVYPGIDTDKFTPDPASARAGAPTFLYVGRLKRYKGVDVAIRAMGVVRERRPDIRLEIAGSGDDRARLERLVRELDLESSVTFLGFVSDEVKRAHLRGAWATVYPSPKEGWGITNLESAACGTPAIASDTSALRESVRHGETGFLVPHGDEHALAHQMLALATDAALVSGMGAQARRFAESFSWDRTADETEKHLEACRVGKIL